MSSVDVIIVNWNAGDLLRNCVDSIAVVAEEVDLGRVVIVDNASTDDSLDFLKRSTTGNTGDGTRGPRSGPTDSANGSKWGTRDGGCIRNLRLELIENEENLGFAAACNRGARRSTSDYLLFLNPDTRLKPGALKVPTAFLDDTKNADVGIVGIQLVDGQNRVLRTCARLPTPPRAIAQMARLDAVLPRLSHYENKWDHENTCEVDQVMGAFFFTRRFLFEEIDGFDERFFVYLEEVDFTKRAYERGWSTWYLSAAQAFHHGGGTTRQVADRRLFYALRSRILYFFKHFGPLSAMAYVATVFSLEFFARLAHASPRRSSAAVRDILSGYGMLLKDLPDILRRARADARHSRYTWPLR